MRSIFRAAELSEGFDGKLANDEVTFMVLEGAMVVIACISLTVFHPGVSFGGKWDQGNFKFRPLKQGSVEMTNGQRSAGRETQYESDNSLKDPYTQV